MTAEVQRFDEDSRRWNHHNDFPAGKRIRGVVPNSDIVFEANILPTGRGFQMKIGDEANQIVAPIDPPVEYWTKIPGRRNMFTKFKLQST